MESGVLQFPSLRSIILLHQLKATDGLSVSASIVITVCDVYICVFVCVSNSPSGVIFVLCFHGAVIVI